MDETEIGWAMRAATREAAAIETAARAAVLAGASPEDAVAESVASSWLTPDDDWTAVLCDTVTEAD